MENDQKRSLWQRIRNEVRARPIAYSVLAVFMVAGPAVTSVIFPDAPLGVGLIGGMALGAWAAFCAVPGEFF